MSIVLLKHRNSPEDEYEKYIESRLNKKVHFVPLIQHVNANMDTLQQKWHKCLDQIVALIVTSQRGVEALAESVGSLQNKEMKGLLLAKPVYSVGPRTSQRLAENGFTNVKGGTQAGNGRVLANTILEDTEIQSRLQHDKNGFLLFLTGEIRKDVLPNLLKSKGLPLVEHVVYKTAAIESSFETFIGAHDQCTQSTNNWLVFFSSQGTSDIIEHVKHANVNTYKIASIGPTTAQYLKQSGLSPHAVAELPDPAHLFSAMGF